MSIVQTWLSEDSAVMAVDTVARAIADLSLIGIGVTLAEPSGGSLDLLADLAVSVVMTSGTTGLVIGTPA